MKIRKLHKKGFDVNQMFIFVTAVVVVGFVLLFGYKAINGFIQTSADVENLQLKTDLGQLITLVKNDHGSQKFFKSGLPSEFTHVCFFDTESATYDENYCPEALEAVSIRACPIWENNEDLSAQKKNMILIRSDKTVADPLFIPGLRIEDFETKDVNEEVLCINSREIELRLRGVRNQVYVSAVVE